MILDIALIVLALIICFIGYKVGFLTTFLKIASLMSGIIAAILFAKPVANFAVKVGWDNGIQNTVYQNITSSESFQVYYDNGGGVEGTKALLKELGLPSFFSSLIAEQTTDGLSMEEVATKISEKISYVLITIIVFFVLLLFSSLLFFILKLIVRKIRDVSGAIRIVDGVLGIVLYACFYLLLIDVSFLVVSVVIQSSPADSQFVIFMKEQLKMDSNQFGIAKYLYENNILGNLFNLLT